MTLAFKHVFLLVILLCSFQNAWSVELTPQQKFAKTKKMALKGNANAMVALGYAYEKGDIVEQNAKEAGKWFQRASNKGSATGMVNLGLLYTYGEGVPQDIHKAFILFSQASDLNDISGFYYLAKFYSETASLKDNHVVAYSLFTRIVEEGKGKYDADKFSISDDDSDESEYIKANVYSAAQEILSMMAPEMVNDDVDRSAVLTSHMRKKGNVTKAIRDFLKTSLE